MHMGIKGNRMKGFWILFALAAVMMAACQPAETTPQELPTLAVLPSLAPTNLPVDTPVQAAAPSSASLFCCAAANNSSKTTEIHA